MFKKKKEVEPSPLDAAILQIFEELKSTTADTPEYEKAVNQLQKLYAMKAQEKPERWWKAETVVPAVTNLAGIGLILGFEKVNVITSKALGFVTKSKV